MRLQCFVTATAPNLGTYLPEGHAGGDEFQPSSTQKDLVVNCSWSGSNGLRVLEVFLSSSTLKGQCTNSGDNTFADFTIEASRNSEWTIVGPDVSEYALLQSANTADTPIFMLGVTARTTNPVPADTVVPLRITSYDWGGTGSIRVFAGDCIAAAVVFPQDGDDDNLPDEFEMNAKYYTAAKALKTFDPGKKTSADLQAASDDLDDSDLDNRAAPVHDHFGDGLTAFEEYRAVKLKGEVKRTIDWDNDGPGGGKGGTHLKDIFVFDERKDTDQPFFKGDNKFLEDFKLVWHLIDKADMTDEEDLAGFVDKDGDKNQRAVWLHEVKEAITFPGGQQLADAQDRSIKSGKQILIHLKHVNMVADATGVPKARLLNWVVAHEIGHKLTLDHVRRFLDRAAGDAEPAPPNITHFWVTAGGRQTNFFVPMVLAGGARTALEAFDRFEPVPAAPFAVGEIMPAAPRPASETVNIHDRDHRIGHSRVVTAPHSLPAGTTKLVVFAHLRNLMDLAPDPPDLETLEGNPLMDADTPDGLNPAQEKLPDVKS